MSPHRFTRAQFAAGSAAALGGIALRTAPARAAGYEWKIGTDYGHDHPIGIRLIEACAKIAHDTGGAMTLRPFVNGELGSAASMMTQLRSGALEMLVAGGSGVIEETVPEVGIEGVAFTFKDSAQVFAAFDGDLGTIVRGAIAAKGIVVLERLWDQGFRIMMTSTHPIRTVADMQGVKIRTSPSKLRLDTFRTLGLAPVVVNAQETYAALQTHLVDGAESSLVVMTTLHWYDSQKYASLTNHMWGGAWTLANKDAWGALPAPIATVVRSRLDEAALAERRDFELLTGALQDKLTRQGLAFNQCERDSFRAKLAAAGYYARWRDAYGVPVWSAMEKYTGRMG